MCPAYLSRAGFRWLGPEARCELGPISWTGRPVTQAMGLTHWPILGQVSLLPRLWCLFHTSIALYFYVFLVISRRSRISIHFSRAGGCSLHRLRYDPAQQPTDTHADVQRIEDWYNLNGNTITIHSRVIQPLPE